MFDRELLNERSCKTIVKMNNTNKLQLQWEVRK